MSHGIPSSVPSTRDSLRPLIRLVLSTCYKIPRCFPHLLRAALPWGSRGHSGGGGGRPLRGQNFLKFLQSAQNKRRFRNEILREGVQPPGSASGSVHPFAMQRFSFESQCCLVVLTFPPCRAGHLAPRWGGPVHATGVTRYWPEEVKARLVGAPCTGCVTHCVTHCGPRAPVPERPGACERCALALLCSV